MSAEKDINENLKISLKDIFGEKGAEVIEAYCNDKRKEGRIHIEEWKQSKIKRGDIVHPWGSTIAICTSDPYEDPEERKKQVAYWLQKHNIELSENGKLVKVVPLEYNRASKSAIGNKEYIYPIEKIRFKGVRKFLRMLKELNEKEVKE